MSATPQIRRRRRVAPGQVFLYLAAILITLFMLVPLYLLFAAAFSPQEDLISFPARFVPSKLSTDTLQFFFNATGVKDAAKMSVEVGIGALFLSILLGAPAGYAVARYSFPGRNILQMIILATRSFPVIVLSIPLAVTFITWHLFDKAPGVILIHTALALPTAVLITSSVFYGIPRDLEEAAMTLGCSAITAFFRVSLPMALPGLAAASLFTFILSWNEVFAATILTSQNRTLPALVLTDLNAAPPQYRFAGGFLLIAPSLVFIFIIRRYLVSSWGTVTK